MAKLLPLSRKKPPVIPEYEAVGLMFTCPVPYCGAKIFLGQSRLRKRGKQRGSGSEGECKCQSCGRRVHAEITGNGNISSRVCDP